MEKLEQAGTAKGAEHVVKGTVPGGEGRAPRYSLAGYPGRAFLRMNSNSYLALGQHDELIRSEEETIRAVGVGPCAVRFFSCTVREYVMMEDDLTLFTGLCGIYSD